MTTKRRLVAEWEAQSGVMIAWPHESTDWSSILEAVEAVYLELTHHIVSHERLLICCYDTSHENHVRQLLRDGGVAEGRVRYAEVQFNDTWTRDYGPLSVGDGEQIELLDFHFDGWGGKYPAAQDNLVTRELRRQGFFQNTGFQSVDFVLEGGAIDTDGRGTLLTTRRCLSDAKRNSDLSEAEIEFHLRRLLGIERILWLDHGFLAGDETDGHIDLIARFCGAEKIAHCGCTSTDDQHFDALRLMTEQLQTFRQPDGNSYELIPLPLPAPKRNRDGRQMPASYANFLITNCAVLVPIYDDPADTIALERLTKCFPGRTIIPINALPLIQQAGSIHCATMHLPANVLSQ